MGRRTGQIQALVVLPVQELAAQVASVFRMYGSSTGLRVHLSTGGLPLQDDRSRLIRQSKFRRQKGQNKKYSTVIVNF